MNEYAEALLAAADAVVAAWVVRGVERRHPGPLPEDVRQAAERAGEQARAWVGQQLTALLAADVDEQRSNPLALLRAAVRFPTAVLRDAGVPGRPRDEFSMRSFPDDAYDLTPATWADVDPSLHEPGIEWGAWKAQQHLRRHRPTH